MFVTKSRQACRILREDLRFYRDDLDRIKGTPAPATERPDWWPRMAGRAPPIDGQTAGIRNPVSIPHETA